VRGVLEIGRAAAKGHGAPGAGDAALALAREATVVFTSGSGGAPKGVVLTTANHVAAASAANANLPLAAQDCWLADLPFCHVGGLAILFRSALAGSAVLVRDGFAPGATLDGIAAGAVSILSCVPEMLRSLLAADPQARVLSRAKAILLGGEAPDPQLLELCRRLAVPVLPTYGMTEASSQICTAAPGEFDGGARASARPLPGMQVRVVDGNGREAAAGAGGEITIRGPAVFSRYLGGEAAAARDADGWFHTGDLGRFDGEGRLELLGRLDATFISGGENISPAEIESVARRCAAVDDCAVIAAPSRRWGRRPVLYAAPAEIERAELRDWLAARLPKLLMPDDIIVVEELPRLALGKIDRRALLETYLASQEAQPDPPDNSRR
ncbi:AMP-binding protein, partial [bacterium]|nr:AMP-binding protein [bacterium]